MSGAIPNDETGTLGEEASKLMAAAQDWFHRTLGDPSTAKIATGTPECAWCPVCQMIGVLRGDRPELSERFAETQVAVAGLLRALAEAASASVQQHSAHSHEGPTGVQKIDLDGD
ncbi:MAG TPA: hypothetical protein VGH11_04810 [Jatrophihabitans sp.]|jgi:hypothetical protein